jgi:hypothetical protein
LTNKTLCFQRRKVAIDASIQYMTYGIDDLLGAGLLRGE